VYIPVRQNARIFTGVVARAAGDPVRVAAAVREAIWSVDRDQPVWKIRTLDSMVAASTSDERFVMLLMGAFALVALVMASVGIYGIMSYAVSQRTREIGIRMALGAAAGQVLRAVIRQGMTLTLVALIVGLAASWALTRLLSTLLFGVRPTDPSTFGAVAMLLALVALAACWLPARRAARVDPVRAIAAE
jgi:putative ABC transport system permease protein